MHQRNSQNSHPQDLVHGEAEQALHSRIYSFGHTAPIVAIIADVGGVRVVVQSENPTFDAQSVSKPV
jgi:hypothetical protein